MEKTFKNLSTEDLGFIKENSLLSERKMGPIPAALGCCLPFQGSTLQANIWSSNPSVALQPHLDTQRNARCALWHQWDSGRRWEFTARYKERWEKRQEGSGVGAPPKGCISSDESGLKFPGAASSCMPLSSPLAQLRRTGGLYCFGSLPVLGTQSGWVLMNLVRGL